MNSFRDFEKSLCILRDRACINILDPGQASGANGILCYGYVDHAAGLTFEGLALVSCMDDDYTIVLDNDEIGMKIRAGLEPVIATVKGLCPNHLDERTKCREQDSLRIMQPSDR